MKRYEKKNDEVGENDEVAIDHCKQIEESKTAQMKILTIHS